MKKIFLLAVVIALWSCNKSPEVSFPDFDPVIGLATPVHLDIGPTNIFLSDYVLYPDSIDSVFVAGKKINLGEDRSYFPYRAPRESAKMLEMQIWEKGSAFSVLLMKSRKQEVTFIFDPAGVTYQDVRLAGEFNGWTPSRSNLQFVNGRWTTVLYLNPGNYQYQLVRDGKWSVDPNNKDSVDNNAGAFNSLLKVGIGDPSKKPLLITEKAKTDAVYIRLVNYADKMMFLWNNVRIPDEMIMVRQDMIEVTIPPQASKHQRSFIRGYSYNDHGFSNDLLIPLEYGQVFNDPSKLSRSDLHSNILYNVFIDRFNNGDPSNDKPVDDPAILPPANYHGGDILGATQKIEDGYFEKLGVNAVWISPVVRNPEGPYGFWKEPPSKFSGYHGYWPISFTEVDYRFGTPDELKQLVNAAHGKDMNILLDLVAHHVHIEHPVYKQHPDWYTDLYLPDGSLNTERWDEYRLTTWFDVFLPTLNFQKPEVIRMFSDSSVWWIKTYGFDGFRHDACKHIPEAFWRNLTRQLKTEVVIPEGRSVYQLGETYGSPELINSYIGSGMIDAQFDFNVYDAAIGVFGREKDPFTLLNDRLQQSFEYYGYHNLMGYITGNQDRARFISYAGGGLGWEENAKLAGWTRKVEVGDPIGYKRLQSLIAFNMTIPGIPVIYYGDEFGMPGGNDPDSRRMMRFENLAPEEQKTFDITSTLTGLRRSNLALIYGDFIPLLVDSTNYAFARKYFDELAIVFFNKENIEQEVVVQLPAWMEPVQLKNHFGSSNTVNGRIIKVTLPANSFEIFTN